MRQFYYIKGRLKGNKLSNLRITSEISLQKINNKSKNEEKKCLKDPSNISMFYMILSAISCRKIRQANLMYEMSWNELKLREDRK